MEELIGSSFIWPSLDKSLCKATFALSSARAMQTTSREHLLSAKLTFPFIQRLLHSPPPAPPPSANCLPCSQFVSSCVCNNAEAHQLLVVVKQNTSFNKKRGTGGWSASPAATAIVARQNCLLIPSLSLFSESPPPQPEKGVANLEKEELRKRSFTTTTYSNEHLHANGQSAAAAAAVTGHCEHWKSLRGRSNRRQIAKRRTIARRCATLDGHTNGCK